MSSQVYGISSPIMVRIPAGKFLMGTKDEDWKSGFTSMYIREKPQHEVELSEYFIGKYPVTNHEYQVFIKDTKYRLPEGWENVQYPVGKGDHPVVYVSWIDAQAYCKWLSQKTGKQYQLPSEAEWEKAARGTDCRMFPWGDDYDEKKANVLISGSSETTPVGKFSKAGGDSPYGCADMAGNVWEWCNDWFDEYEYEKRSGKEVKDPLGPENGHEKVLRGGSWGGFLGTACVFRRLNIDPHGKSYDAGFRLSLHIAR